MRHASKYAYLTWLPFRIRRTEKKGSNQLTYFEIVVERATWLAFKRRHPDASQDEFQQRWSYPQDDDAGSKAKHHSDLMEVCMMGLADVLGDASRHEEIEMAFAAGYNRACYELYRFIAELEDGASVH
jgi:hypothetical protein